MSAIAVSEAGLPGGTQEGVAPITVTGTISVSDANGLDDIQSISIGGTTVDVSGGLEALVGESIDTGYGTLTITAYDNGQYAFSYTLDERVDNDEVPGATDSGFVESISVVVSDRAASTSASIDITIADDAPEAGFDAGSELLLVEGDIGTALGTATLELDVSGAGTKPGADAPASIAFELVLASDGADSGLRTASGETIRLYAAAGGGVVGRTAGGTDVFTVGLNPATGTITVTMLAAMSHPPGSDVLYMDSNVLFAVVSVTDADGDTDTAQIDLASRVGFGDSSPVITHVENASIDNEAGLSVSGTIRVEAPDAVAAFDLSGSLDNAPAGLIYEIQPDGSLLAKDSTGDTVFTLSIDANGEYTFTLLKPAAEYVASSPSFDSLVIPAGSPLTSAETQLYASYDLLTGAGIGEPITSVVFTGTDNLNPSSDGLGVGDNLIDDLGKKFATDALSMQFADDLSNASLNIGNFKDTDALHWKVYKDGVVVDSGVITNTYVDANGNVQYIENSESPNYWLDLSRNGLDDGVLFDKLELTAADGTGYKFIGLTVEKPVTVEDMNLHFDVVARDGDGDASGGAQIVVSVDGSGSTIDDTAGDTVLVGGEGADVFRWTLAETGAHDKVTDFDAAQSFDDGGDALNLNDLLPAESDRTGDLTHYLHFEKSGDNTLLKISSNGEFTGNATDDAGVAHQTIELLNVDLLSLGSDQQIIDHLVSSGKLITD